MIIPENLIHFVTYPVTAISIIANLALIFIILTTNNTQIGAYRFLLLAFSVVDIFISIVHFTLVPGIQMTEFGFIFFGFRFMQSPTDVGIWAGLIFVALFYQTFVLLCFHYVYRYVVLCNPSWLRWMQDHPWIKWICVGLTIDLLYIGGFMLAIKGGFLPKEHTRTVFQPILIEAYNIDLTSPNMPGYLGIAYWLREPDGTKGWLLRPMVSLTLVMILFFGSGLVIILCIWKVMSAMKRTDSHMATRTRQMQHQLFRALLVQTIVPTTTSYVPLGSVFILPLTGLSMGSWGTIAMMSTALFPLIDPFLVVLLVSGYRSKLPFFVRRVFNSSTTSTTKTISIHGKSVVASIS